MTEVVVELRGGVVVEVYCDDPQIRPVLVDWDSLESPKATGSAGFVWNSCPPLMKLPEDTRAQFQKALVYDGDEPRIITT